MVVLLPWRQTRMRDDEGAHAGCKEERYMHAQLEFTKEELSQLSL